MSIGFKLFLLALLATVSIGASFYIYNANTSKPDAAIETATESTNNPTPAPESLDVTAENGQLTPSEFTVMQHQTKILQIEAKDQDYTFTINDFKKSIILPKGQTTQVELYGEAVGSHDIDCGNGCQAVLIVPDNDADSEIIQPE